MKFLFVLSVFVVAHRASAATVLTFPNSEMFTLHESSVSMTDAGPKMDSVTNANSEYEDIVPEAGGQKIIDAVITLTAGYLGGGPFAEWPDNGHVHGGVGIRFNGGSADMAGLAMLSAESDELQLVDRFGGTEYITRRSISGGIAYDQPYRILLECTSGDAVRVRLYNATTSALLDDYSFTLTVGSTAAGTPFIHTYACAMVVNSFQLRTSADSIVIEGSLPFASLYSAPPGPRLLCSGGALDMFSDGTNGSVNSWSMGVSKYKRGSVVMTGSMKRVSSTRIMGIVLRHNGVQGGTCYILYHDTSGGLKFGRFSGTTLTAIQTSAKTLTTGTSYPFTLTVSGNDYTLVIDGTTFGPFTDTTYTTEGYVGFLGYQTNAQFSDIVISDRPPSASISGTASLAGSASIR